ncbi:MAG: glycosyltransferase family 2 protein [Candidatus Harrisonbacteria bacterium]|nr:glycosyltransferase family 2 protein [Candidatus Harrisonbacteria bacterium]
MRLRLFDFIPGTISWLTLFLVLFLSWQKPVWVAIFIILFDIYWLLKSIYFSLHLRATFEKMRHNLRLSWLERLGIFADWKAIHHLVILPMVDEPYEVVKETFENLKNSNYPKEKLLVVLAIEERAGSMAAEVAKKIEKEFSAVFPWFLITKHPINLPGEIPGKGANETWAAKEAKKMLIDKLKIPYENTIVSVFDVDTQIYPEYFGCLTYNFLTADKPQRSSFQPIPLFTNNIYQAPALGRVISFSATFWQMMQQSRPERLTTFSSHSMPFGALTEIGYWQTDIVSEDSRIFWQCYLHYNGDWRVVPLFYPVSMDANVAPTFWKTMFNIYKQQRRWAWGVENIPYILKGFAQNKFISIRNKLYWSFHVIEGFHSWATNSLMIFALGWLPLLIGEAGFRDTVISYNLPGITRTIMLFASVGIASSAILSVVLLPPKPEGIRWRHYLLYVVQWAFLPVTLIIFGSFPALEAQTRLVLGGKFRLGFWVTPKIRKSK